VLNNILEKAMSRHPQIQNIVLASRQGLVIAYKSRTGARGLALSAFAAMLNDAGETTFGELSLGPLGEVMLLGPEGAVYQVRCRSSMCFVLLSAVSEANVGLLKMVASEIETEASEVLQSLLGGGRKEESSDSGSLG